MQQFKACPQCQQPAPLDAPVCSRCGRQFRTQFVPPDQTQMFTSPMHATRLQQQPKTKYFQIIGIAILITALFGLGAWGTYRYLNPYPFLGDWFFTSNTNASLYRFSRDGSGMVYTVNSGNSIINSQPGMPQEDPAVTATPITWKASGDKLLMEFQGPQTIDLRFTWSISDDGTTLSLVGGTLFDTVVSTGRFVRRSSLPTEPLWLKKIQ